LYFTTSKEWKEKQLTRMDKKYQEGKLTKESLLKIEKLSKRLRIVIFLFLILLIFLTIMSLLTMIFAWKRGDRLFILMFISAEIAVTFLMISLFKFLRSIRMNIDEFLVSHKLREKEESISKKKKRRKGGT
jgi:ABC-type multidrug transport system fused ATPase/permease subunit